MSAFHAAVGVMADVTTSFDEAATAPTASNGFAAAIESPPASHQTRDRLG
jgi:hypothetical protein